MPSEEGHSKGCLGLGFDGAQEWEGLGVAVVRSDASLIKHSLERMSTMIQNCCSGKMVDDFIMHVFHFHPFSTLDPIKGVPQPGCSEMVSIRVQGFVTSNLGVNHLRTLFCVRGWKGVRGFKSAIPQRYLVNSFPTKLCKNIPKSYIWCPAWECQACLTARRIKLATGFPPPAQNLHHIWY